MLSMRSRNQSQNNASIQQTLQRCEHIHLIIMTPSIRWQCIGFHELSGKQIYLILQARNAVFAVEQNCVYQDMDDVDFTSLHLIGWAHKNQLAAYLRITAPNTCYPEPSLGRVLSTVNFRGQGIGRQLMAEGLKQTNAHYPGQAIRINAQVYLREFYRSFGFDCVSEEYLEDGIVHVEMLRPAMSNHYLESTQKKKSAGT